ncbi:acetyl-CoA hydrolase [Desulfobacter hydrogenophilus]|uniref:Acetyl-CoA hydrolase n=1 Tax=Desulfobacter hydrogenophilus TaxID=2291 RepID=A0A328FD78_9BACT|nr:acetyl-CoA hydrolase/transferase C-terminal domain-containing protein [Desulfobacter hydrogenophilus]NDY73793.1 acetyl-CoA hydrolase [Desulfobacter hydrogenophilus]QBH14623.1 acetyl-CoA hydrolase [Desulfobacter hydrogenophilus]RAM01015.1 acetyl-CoA hydrolase [Desulfobacter hydrogenophilus]
MSILEERVRCKELLSKVKTPEECIQFFKDGMNVGMSGFTPVGYPKVVPIALCDHVEKNNLQGKFRLNLFIGASVGAEVEDRMATLNMIDRRWPYQTGKNIGKGINSGRIRMGDKHLSMFPQDLKYGFYTMDKGGKLDMAVIEASAITENGDIILSGAVGAAPEIIDVAENIIVEINTGLPSFEGMHDITMTDLPPNRQVIPITDARQRIGTPWVPTDKSKIIAIVESKNPDNGRALRGTDDVAQAIADNIVDFFKVEVKAGRLPKNLLPLQSGVGSIANAVVGGLTASPFENLTVFTEVLQDTFLPFLDSGKCDYINCTSLSLSNEAFVEWWEKFDKYKEMVLMRPQQISNNPELIRRLGVIAMNTPLEFDMYAHANSTHAGGTRMLNGIGGSGDFIRNAYISMMHCPSCRATKNDEFGLTGVVTKVPHVDHTEHDIDVLVTEQGLADLRGLAPIDRARVVIDKCAHPAYKDYLTDYLERSIKKTGGHHEPHLLDECYKMHQNFIENGTMRFWEK